MNWLRGWCAALLLLGLTACGDTCACVPPERESLTPTGIPAAPEPVRSLFPAVVMDTGDGPELCLGPVAESYPPQCAGPPIADWSWDAVAEDSFDRSGQVRWGSYGVWGTWDGTTFSVTRAVPADRYEIPVPAPTEAPTPSRHYSARELDDVASELLDLPGALDTSPQPAGWISLGVIYDDGTLQASVDERYGDGVVLIHSALMALGE